MPTQPLAASEKFSTEQEQAILRELACILRSVPFRSSRRISLMLEHCVRTTVAGDVELLRERQVGVDVFAREPGYETSSDPVVRMAAGEVRKRLAQFYASQEHESPVRISLPTGGYGAEFRFREAETPRSAVAAVNEWEPAPVAVEAATPQPVPVASVRPPLRRRVYRTAVATALVLLAAVFVAFAHRTANPVSPFFYGLGNSGSTIVVLGPLPRADTERQQPLPLGQDIFQPDGAVTFEGATSAVAVCSSLARAGGSCSLREAAHISLYDLQHRPTILFGAYNNPWALRVTQDLPFRFGPLDCKCIVESGTAHPVGTVDFSLPREKIFVDYSIVSRFQSQVTDGPVLVIAGVGPMSTQAAAEFASSPDLIAEVLRVAPKSWKQGNFELVLGTEIVGGVPGHTKIVRNSFW